MKNRLFGRRRAPRRPGDRLPGADALPSGLDGRASDLGATDRATGETSWDRPAEDDVELLRSDDDAGGPPWDHPGDERFAPPVRDLHWAFQPPGEEAGRWRGGDSVDVADTRTADRTLEDPQRLGASDGPWSWDDGASLVTAGGGPRTEPPRDPDQPGLFDPYDAFAPVVADDEWALPPRSVALPMSLSAPPPVRPPAGPASEPAAEPASRAPSARESVFGDMFLTPGHGATPRAAHDPVVERDAPSALDRRAGSDAPDPRDWPPIPTDLLPPIAHPPAPDTAPAEPDGRRFGWPPPRPRVSSAPASSVGDPALASDPRPATPAARGDPDAEQPSLWNEGPGAAAPADRVLAARLALDAATQSEGGGSLFAAGPPDAERPGVDRAGVDALSVIAVAAVVVAAVVLAAQLVLPLLR